MDELLRIYDNEGRMFVNVDLSDKPKVLDSYRSVMNAYESGKVEAKDFLYTYKIVRPFLTQDDFNKTFDLFHRAFEEMSEEEAEEVLRG